MLLLTSLRKENALNGFYHRLISEKRSLFLTFPCLITK
ncbi:hypothetical protein CUZ87_0290 [Enterococcus xinjiangensis]|nr:hypothetical protein [Enterococcus lactis]